MEPARVPIPPPVSAEVLAHLRSRGVAIPAPEQVYVSADVPLDAIAAGCALLPGTRLTGPRTRVDAGATIGVAAPATLENAWVGAGSRIGTLGPVTLRETAAGPGTVLGCGVAEQAVFLGKEANDPDFTTGYGFRVRKGSLYEEDANSAQHTDTKMTVLFPWVTLGSNLNWCDVVVTGGVGPEPGAFSEVGSGAVHFNFTPRGDKATGSLLGSVVDGVFLRAPRIFLGGNATLVGPLRAKCGAVTAAGGRYTRDLAAGLNVPDGPVSPGAAAAFELETYGSVRRIVLSQLALIGELAALEAWYGHVRARLAAGDAARRELYARARKTVALNRSERIAHLGLLARLLDRSIARLEGKRPGDPRIVQHRSFVERWPGLEAVLQAERNEPPPPGPLLEALDAAAARHTAYTAVIQALPEEAVTAGRAWMADCAEAGAPAAQSDALVPPLGSGV